MRRIIERNKTIKRFADKVVRDSKRNARGTKMAKRLTWKFKNNGLAFIMPEYGIYQSTGVGGSKYTNVRVGKAQKKAIRLGVINRKFRYTNKRPPMSAFSGYASTKGGQYAIATSIFDIGFPTGKGHLNWFTKPIEDALDDFEDFIRIDDIQKLIFPEDGNNNN